MFNLRSKYLYFLAIKIELIKYFKKIFFTTNFYFKTLISNTPENFYFFPNPLLLSTFVNYKNFSFKISKVDTNYFWDGVSKNEELAVNSFLWLGLVDRKNDAKIIQKIIKDWIFRNSKYRKKIWDNAIISQRIISWILNAQIILNNADNSFKKLFLRSIIIQINHVKKNLKFEDNKIKKLQIISSLLLSGLVFKEYNVNLNISIKELEKFVSEYYDSDGFPKNKNIDDLITSTKYLILIKECCKDAQEFIPEYLEDILDKNLNCLLSIKTPTGSNPLFNGAVENKMEDFFLFIKNLNYKKKGLKTKVGNLEIIKTKKIFMLIDVGDPPQKNFSGSYQSGPLSFELFFNNEKVITNCGYGKNISKKIEILSRLTSAQSTLTLNDTSVVNFERNNIINKVFGRSIKETFKINDVERKEDEIFINLSAKHNAYDKKYGYFFKRSFKVNKKDESIVGQDTLIKSKDNVAKANFNIRFHLYPGISAVPTMGGNSILIQINKNSSLIFFSKNESLTLEKSIFMGRNQLINNYCINISGSVNNQNKVINWVIKKNI